MPISLRTIRICCYTAQVMTGVQRDHGVHGQRPIPALFCCVLLGPDGVSTSPDLDRSLRDRSAQVTRPSDPYHALVELIELERRPKAAEADRVVLLLLEPDEHLDRCIELAKAARVFTPRVLIWQHCQSETPRLSGFVIPKADDEQQQIEAIRQEARQHESPYEMAARLASAPTLRLVIDEDDQPDPQPEIVRPEVRYDDDTHPSQLTDDELDMLMDPLFDPVPRRGGDKR